MPVMPGWQAILSGCVRMPGHVSYYRLVFAGIQHKQQHAGLCIFIISTVSWLRIFLQGHRMVCAGTLG